MYGEPRGRRFVLRGSVAAGAEVPPRGGRSGQEDRGRLPCGVRWINWILAVDLLTSGAVGKGVSALAVEPIAGGFARPRDPVTFSPGLSHRFPRPLNGSVVPPGLEPWKHGIVRTTKLLGWVRQTQKRL